MRAADYTASGLNVNSCPSNYTRIVNEEDCERAAKVEFQFELKGAINLPGYARGCQLASYGNSFFVLLNLAPGVGNANPFSRLLCAKDKPCAPGTYQLPVPTTQSKCSDCPIGTFQPHVGQPSCEPCRKGYYGVKPRAESESDGCQPCPPGTYAGDTSGACSVCAPGTASKLFGMGGCDACPGPNAFARCPGGAVAPYTDAQLAVAQQLVPTSPKSPLERCQTHPARFVRKAGTSVVNGADNPNALLAPVVLGPVAALVTAAVVILMLHSFIPEWLWSNVDFTAQFHKVPQGGASVRANTPLGCAFTLAFVFLASALVILMHALNRPTEVNALVPPRGGTLTTNLRILLGLPAGNPFPNDTALDCAGIAYFNDSFQGMTCEDASMSLGSTCTIVLTGCRFVTPSAQLTFSVPWSERFVSWSVSVDSTAEATEHQVSGVVTSGDAASLVSPKKGVVVAIQAQPAFLNDTTDAELDRHGFLLNQLPCVPPLAVNTTEGWNVMGPDLAWNLTLELRLSPTLYETVRSMKQGPLELAASIFTTVLAVMGVWRAFFSHVEGPVSNLRKRLSRRRQIRREGPPSGVELQQPNDRMALLARVISNTKPDDSAAQAAVKEERNARLKADEELHEMIVRMMKEYDHAIRQLTQKVEQLTQEKVAV